MIKKSLWIYIALGAVLVISMALNGFLYNKMPKTAYVDIHQVFEEFNGQKEMKGRLTNLGSKHKMHLDSLALKIRAMQSRANASSPKAMLTSLETQQRNYMALNNEFLQQYEEQDQEYTDVIWNQINQYITEYGKEHNYDYIYGASGNGTLMYAGNQKDISKTIIEYINQKYEGL